jgi:hypothetical protein
MIAGPAISKMDCVYLWYTFFVFIIGILMVNALAAKKVWRATAARPHKISTNQVLKRY